jgi:hypothetical protein
MRDIILHTRIHPHIPMLREDITVEVLPTTLLLIFLLLLLIIYIPVSLCHVEGIVEAVIGLLVPWQVQDPMMKHLLPNGEDMTILVVVDTEVEDVVCRIRATFKSYSSDNC